MTPEQWENGKTKALAAGYTLEEWTAAAPKPMAVPAMPAPTGDLALNRYMSKGTATAPPTPAPQNGEWMNSVQEMNQLKPPPGYGPAPAQIFNDGPVSQPIRLPPMPAKPPMAAPKSTMTPRSTPTKPPTVATPKKKSFGSLVIGPDANDIAATKNMRPPKGYDTPQRPGYKDTPVGTDRSSKDLSLADPQLQKAYSTLAIALQQKMPGLRMDVRSTTRSVDDQLKAFESGNSERDGIVKISRHNYEPSQAFDIVLMDRSGKEIQPAQNMKAYIFLGQMAQKMGLRWGGDWNGNGIIVAKDPAEKFEDYGHFEIPEDSSLYNSISQAVNTSRSSQRGKSLPTKVTTTGVPR